MRWQAPVEPEEVAALRRRYGDFPVEEVTLEVGERFFEDARTPLGKTRRGEILAVVVGPDGRVLVHTKRFYPRGVFRLISGGIQVGEPVEEALVREIREETGQEVRSRCFIGLIVYRILHGAAELHFASYVYRVDVPDLSIASQDDAEEISGFRWVPLEALDEVRQQLLAVPPEWQDWGRFRAVGHAFVLRHAARCQLR